MRTHRRTIPALLLAVFIVACGNGDDDGPSTNNASTNGSSNNGSTSNGATNGSTNNGSTNNASTNGSTNNASTNGSTNNASTNNTNNTTNTNNTNNGTAAMCASQGECISNEDCPADQRCEDVSTDDVEMPCCVVGARGTGTVGEMCEDENDCESGLCIQRNNNGPFICSKSCEGPEDCPDDLECHDVLGLCVTP